MPGCTDSRATNYVADATLDSGACTLPTEGCTDSRASNYEAEAQLDDGTAVAHSGDYIVAAGDSGVVAGPFLRSQPTIHSACSRLAFRSSLQREGRAMEAIPDSG